MLPHLGTSRHRLGSAGDPGGRDRVVRDHPSSPGRTALTIQPYGDASVMFEPGTMHMAADHQPRLRIFRRPPEPLAIGVGEMHRHLDPSEQGRAREPRPFGLRGLPLEWRYWQRIVVHERDERGGARLLREPLRLRAANEAETMLHDQPAAVEADGTPRGRHGIDDGKSGAISERFHERGSRRHAGRPRRNLGVERAPPSVNERRRIPEPADQPPDVRPPPRMSAARREIVVSMNDREPRRVEQAALRERIEDFAEQTRVPAIEDIAGDREMVGDARGDAIELAFQPPHIAAVPDVQIGQVREQHPSDLRAQAGIVRWEDRVVYSLLVLSRPAVLAVGGTRRVLVKAGLRLAVGRRDRVCGSLVCRIERVGAAVSAHSSPP